MNTVAHIVILYMYEYIVQYIIIYKNRSTTFY